MQVTKANEIPDREFPGIHHPQLLVGIPSVVIKDLRF